MVKTIVTSDLLKEVIVKNDIEFVECYTGFKYIAEEIRKREGVKTFIAGGEESFGYLIGDFVRDKDAVSACCFAAELLAWAKEQGKSLYELLIDIYVEYGFYKELNLNMVKKGKTGQEEIQEMMKQFRFNPPKTMDGSLIQNVLDYSTLTNRNVLTNTTIDIDQPTSSNVIQFITEDGTKLSIRPSGTEPKIKFYISVNLELESKADFAKVNADLDAKIERISKELGF
jgi:phosphoglucomutase